MSSLTMFRWMMELFLLTLLLVFRLGGGSSLVTSGICPSCSTLDDLYEDWNSHKRPKSGSNLYVPPNETVLDEFQRIVSDMMQAASTDACTSIDVGTLLQGQYAIEVFTVNAVHYCVFATLSIDTPWGMVIVNLRPDAKRLSLDAVHPAYDTNTGRQSLAVFQGLQAKSLVLAGSHRYASETVSECDYGGYRISDAAHTIDGVQAAVQAIQNYYHQQQYDYTAIQFHGMGSSTCPGVDAYLTFGQNAAPQAGEKIVVLRDILSTLLLSMEFNVTVPGDTPTCGLTGTTNTQGRLLNGVGFYEACTQPADSYSGKFIHIEQKLALRNEDMYDTWIQALDLFYDQFYGQDDDDDTCRWGLFKC